MGKFDGLTDIQWELISSLLPKKTNKIGRPNPDFRKVLNTILYVGITGCRWCDVPVGDQWGKRSTSHEWLGHFQEKGIWDKLRNALLSMADLANLINWDKGLVDGSFSPWKRRRTRC